MTKIENIHISRDACIYVRQSTFGQVINNTESQRIQYRLTERAKELGWSNGDIRVIDCDLGFTASGCVDRRGFEELLSDTCAGKIGAIFSVEASRLARNGREWHTLLEICKIMNTIIIDKEAVYDLSLSNDRLLLGLKGEMSTMELSLFRDRSQSAIQEKAKRGELYLTIPAAYIKTDENKLEKNPDKRIQEAISLVFKKFREYGTMCRVRSWFVEKKVKLPVISNGRGKRCVLWKIPGKNTILRMLDNPVYAGAYAFGRTKTEVEFVEGRKRLKKGIRKEQKDWDVLILDHHEGYIDWDEYQNNLKALEQNTNKKRPVVKGSVRGGKALLVGLLRCGHCGRKLFVRYHGRNGSHKSYHCGKIQNDKGEKSCLSFGGFRVDKVVSDHLLNVLSPFGIEASIKAINTLNDKSGKVMRQRELELEQVQYYALRAERQYNAVDPDNRLVAATLEKKWNDALVEVEILKNEIKSLQESTPPLSSREESEIREISQDLPRVWNHPSSPLELKKRIIRAAIKEIIVKMEESKIKLFVHWEGGDHTELEVHKNKSKPNQVKTNIETKKIISELARIMPDKQIVAFLNRIGKTTAKGHSWNPVRLRAFRSNNSIAVYREGEREKRGEFTVDEASVKLGVSRTKVWRLIHQKILPAKQACPMAPWIILKRDLESDAVKLAARSRLPRRPRSENPKQRMLNFQ